MAKPKVYLAVGHGLTPDGKTDSPGAVGGGWSEQSAGDIIVKEAADLLRSWGADVKDESYSKDPNFKGTAKLANAWKADYCVAVHHDWSKAPEGAFGHWYSVKGKKLADDIQAAVGAAGFKLRPSWHKRRTDLSLLKETTMPCVIYECGRIGQESLNEPAELKAMGRAIAAGIAKHVGLQTTPKPEPKPEPEHASKSGLFYGDGKGHFRWGDAATREEVDEVLARHIERDHGSSAPKPPVEKPGVISLESPLVGFVDVDVQDLLRRISPTTSKLPTDRVADLARFYLEWCEKADLDVRVVWAQMMLETGSLAYSGQVTVQSNNYAGIKTTDGKTFARFETMEAGVVAHTMHVAWYAYEDHLDLPECSLAHDPRHLEIGGKPHKGSAKKVGDLGPWAGWPAGNETYPGKIVRVWNAGV